MIIRLDQNYRCEKVAINEDYELTVEPVWASEIEEYGYDDGTPAEYDIIISDTFSDEEPTTMTIGSYSHGEKQELIVGDDEIVTIFYITLMDKNKIKIEVE
jgi:hypothetical protein